MASLSILSRTFNNLNFSLRSWSWVFLQPFIALSVSVFHQKFLPLPLTLGPRILECAHCAQFAVYTAFHLQICTVHTHSQHNTHPFLLQTLPNAFWLFSLLGQRDWINFFLVCKQCLLNTHFMIDIVRRGIINYLQALNVPCVYNMINTIYDGF